MNIVRALTMATSKPDPLCYLATPYTKYRDGIEQAFEDAARVAARLLAAGVRVYSPIVHSHRLAVIGGLNPLDHTIWLPFNEKMLGLADVLIVAHLDGWQESVGTAHEIKSFEDSDRPIYDCDPRTLTMTKRRGRLTYEANEGAA